MKKTKKSTTTNIARLAALPFAYDCGRRGAIISLPLVGDARYDFIVDSGATAGALFRVKVVKASPEPNSDYYCINTQKMVGRTKIPFARDEVDMIATCINGDWYFFSQPHSLTSNQRIHPTHANSQRNNWAELRLPTIPIYEI